MRVSLGVLERLWVLDHCMGESKGETGQEGALRSHWACALAAGWRKQVTANRSPGQLSRTGAARWHPGLER